LLAVHGHEPRLRRQHLPEEIAALCQDRGQSNNGSTPPRARRDHDLERLQDELGRNGGNVKAAAAALGISRQRVYRLLDERGVASSKDEDNGNQSSTN
jgi:DNA-binding NtrC family response regulator